MKNRTVFTILLLIAILAVGMNVKAESIFPPNIFNKNQIIKQTNKFIEERKNLSAAQDNTPLQQYYLNILDECLASINKISPTTRKRRAEEWKDLRTIIILSYMGTYDLQKQPPAHNESSAQDGSGNNSAVSLDKYMKMAYNDLSRTRMLSCPIETYEAECSKIGAIVINICKEKL